MPSSSEIRQQFLDFFCQKHGHTFVASSPVVPLDDPTLLFANAGMNQFKPYFLGTQKPPQTRVANTQKCIRAGGKHNDLDDVGLDTYHHTFFEMLGNWSFGDYFKKDAITWAWELLTEVWQIDKTRLHVTVFEGDEAAGIPRDDEAADIWKAVGVLPGHIHLGNKKDNFWEMGDTGPCGPCTEIHYDRTADKSGAKLVNGGSDQVIEIWNNVFIQFNRNADKSLTPLPAKHVDTGMGFERICAVLNGKTSNYDTDVFTPIFEAIQKATDAEPYTAKMDDLKDIAYRVIADHIRTLTFALTDGAVIGNLGRDYVLKRILRRAERYGRQCLGTDGPFLHKLVPTVVEQLGTAFPELKRNPEKVREQIRDEEVAFLRNLDRGIKLFMKIADKTKVATGTVVSGTDAFELYDTYGIYIDITQQMAKEQGLTVDVTGYEKAMEEAKERARKGGKKFVVAAVKGELPKTDDAAKFAPETIEAKVVGWVVDNTMVTTGKVTAGEKVGLVLDRTNFYGEQGGQVGDTGTIDDLRTQGVEFQVEDTQRLGDTVLHFGTLLDGEIAVGDTMTLAPSPLRRIDVMRNHTATHLMNLGLRTVLGGHVEQKGSLVDEAKTRFDFSHDKPLTGDEVRQIEAYVNQRVSRDLPVTAVTLPLEQAKKVDGVRAVFGEKYPDPVRVVMVGPETPEKANHDDSVEFCGGTHMLSTGGIGYFKITAQEPVAKGVRRVTAVTGRVAAETMTQLAATVGTLTDRFQCKPEELPTRVGALDQEIQRLNEQLKRAVAMTVDGLLESAPTINGTKVVVGQLPPAGVDVVRQQLDRVKQKAKSAFIVFGWDEGDKVPLVVALTPDLAKKAKAGEVIKPLAAIIGGKGGGKPDFAQAGGTDAGKLPEALAKAKEMATQVLE
ncbi:alanine--tRNA ligase [Limnoglobus roseus]|uniref:Alanine--tRNA ligase n=1 Tax=Limnoglobus roseus TaxID=2598579 RepID=A0A5C1AD86_9BACT|nr:alanine--tRNA ligase [Limnoglobus roseus]QEL17319.1 alanine--tRNA ligase [Limnoglobus roseus]